MAGTKFLCYRDINGSRGYIPPHTPYIIRQISDTKVWLETDEIMALISVDKTPESGQTQEEADAECMYHTKEPVLGFVSKEENAIKWVFCEDDSQFIGTFNCVSVSGSL